MFEDDMHSGQGIYTINGNFYHDRTSAEKSLSSVVVPTMPGSTTDIQTEKQKERKFFRFLRSRKGKVAFTVDFVIFVVVLALIVLIEFGVVPHHHSGFYCDDAKYNFKYEGDTVTMGYLLTIVYLGPLLIIFLVEMKNNKKMLPESGKKLWHWYKQFLLGITINLVITELMKVIIGEPRPHFFDTCRPDTAVNCTRAEFVPHYTCTNTNIKKWFVLDSSKSFPSGHSSLSVFSSAFTIWYLQRCFLGLSCILIKPLIQTVLFASCILCSLSRISDHRHHWWDVLAGGVLGFLCALYTVVVFCRNFKRPPYAKPRPSHSTCTLLTDTTNKHATSVVL